MSGRAEYRASTASAAIPSAVPSGIDALQDSHAGAAAEIGWTRQLQRGNDLGGGPAIASAWSEPISRNAAATRGQGQRQLRQQSPDERQPVLPPSSASERLEARRDRQLGTLPAGMYGRLATSRSTGRGDGSASQRSPLAKLTRSATPWETTLMVATDRASGETSLT